MSEEEIEAVAKAIYRTHLRPPSPAWENTSDAVRAWVRKQAASALGAMHDHNELNDPLPF